MRFCQPEGTRGSLKWIQRAVNNKADILQPEGLAKIEWRSPLAKDDYAEYRDGDFLERLGLEHLKPKLKKFWPPMGPQWDALGLSSEDPILVEAKAHIGEFRSPPSGAKSLVSKDKIKSAFVAVCNDLIVTNGSDWTKVYYQYANRISHLWWLREQGLDAKLLFVSFLNDDEMNGPKHQKEWEDVFAEADRVLGLPQTHKLSEYIHHIYPNVNDIP